MLRASAGSLNSSVSDCCSGSLTRITKPSKWPDTVLQDRLRLCGLAEEAVRGPNWGTSSEQRQNTAFQLTLASYDMVATCRAQRCMSWCTCRSYIIQGLRVLATSAAVQLYVVLRARFKPGHDGGARVSWQCTPHGLRGRRRLSDLHNKVIKSLLSCLPWQRKSVWGNVRNDKPGQIRLFSYRGGRKIKMYEFTCLLI